MLARSDPAPGSLYPWHHSSVPATIPGRNRAALLVGAERDERRAEQRLADVPDAARRPRPGVLLEVHDLLVERQAPAAVLLRPGDAGPAVGAEVALPRQALLEEAVVVAGPPRPRTTAKSAASESSRKVRTSSRKASSSALNRRSMARDATGRPDGPSDRSPTRRRSSPPLARRLGSTPAASRRSPRCTLGSTPRSSWRWRRTRAIERLSPPPHAYTCPCRSSAAPPRRRRRVLCRASSSPRWSHVTDARSSGWIGSSSAGSPHLDEGGRPLPRVARLEDRGDGWDGRLVADEQEVVVGRERLVHPARAPQRQRARRARRWRPTRRPGRTARGAARRCRPPRPPAGGPATCSRRPRAGRPPAGSRSPSHVNDWSMASSAHPGGGTRR